MSWARVEKQPNEKYYIGASIYDVQDSDEFIVLGSSSVAAVDKDGTDVAATLLNVSTLRLDDDGDGGANNVIEVLLQAGSASASPYKVSFLMSTNKGQTWEQDILVYVNDV
jgi:hypothetical protein